MATDRGGRQLREEKIVLAHEIDYGSKDVERRRIERALARLEEAVSRCREEDVRDGTGVFSGA